MACPNEIDERELVIQYVLDGKDLSGLNVVPVPRGFKLQTFGKFSRPITPALIDEFEERNGVSPPRAHIDLVNHDLGGFDAYVIGPQSHSSLGHGEKTFSLATLPIGQDLAQLVILAYPLGIKNDMINLPGAFDAYKQLVDSCMDYKVPAGTIKNGYGMLVDSESRSVYEYVKGNLEGGDWVVTTLGNGIRVQKDFKKKLDIDQAGLDRLLNEHKAPHCTVERSYDLIGKDNQVYGNQGFISLGHGSARFFIPDKGDYAALELRGGRMAVKDDMNRLPNYARAFSALNEMVR